MAPIEIRDYYRVWTRDDARASRVPVRLPTGPMVEGVAPFDLFYRVGLQYRVYLRGATEGGKPTGRWSEWMPVPAVLEGYPTVTQDMGASEGKEKAPEGA